MKRDELLLAGLLSNLFYSIAFPVVHIAVVSNLDSRVMSLCSLISCIITVLVTKSWLTNSTKLYKKFKLMLLLESIFYGVLLIAFITNTITNQMYYIADTLLFASISRNIMCGCTRLKAIRYKDHEREEYDNKNNIVSNIASIFGFGISSIIKLDINIAFICMFIGIIADNIIYFRVYRVTNKEYLN